MHNSEPILREKRICDRFPCCGEVIFSGINRDERIRGTIINFSPNGMCIVSNRPVKVGTGITVRLAGRIDTEPGVSATPRSIAVAEVKWCKRIEKDYSVSYCLGLRYLIRA